MSLTVCHTVTTTRMTSSLSTLTAPSRGFRKVSLNYKLKKNIFGSLIFFFFSEERHISFLCNFWCLAEPWENRTDKVLGCFTSSASACARAQTVQKLEGLSPCLHPTPCSVSSCPQGLQYPLPIYQTLTAVSTVQIEGWDWPELSRTL